MNPTAEETLEFLPVVNIVRRYIASPLGAAALDELRPFDTRVPAEGELAAVGEAMEYLRGAEQEGGPAGNRPPGLISFRGIHDVRPAVAKLAIEGAELEPLEIFRLLELLDRAGDIRSVLTAAGGRFPRLAEIAGGIREFRPLLRDLEGKILPDGRIADYASPALRRIRRETAQQKDAIRNSLERFVQAHSQEGSLQGEYITIRNDRLVVPIRAAEKRRVEGVIHAASSTGQTLFVEPLETIDLNNRLVRLAEEELQEIRRILREMTARLARYAASIAASAAAVAALDVLFARARFGLEFGATVPRFSSPDQPKLHLRNARHPLVEDVLRRRGDSAVPASLTLDAEHRVLILSGPNTGGKTVALKTVGLLALMARAGLPAPAEEAEFPWFDQVLADIGDAQSIQESLSSFSAHIAAIRTMIETATPASLVLIDEMGAATDPQEGGALGIAVAEHFRRTGAFTLISTHLPALKFYGVNTPGVLSASLGFDENTLQPNYRLAVGLPGKSAGIEIARRLGIPAGIIERAEQALTTQDREIAALLGELHRRVEELRTAEENLERQREQLARREREIQREWEKREKARLEELERRVDAMLEKFNAQASQVVARISETSQGRKAASEAARRAARAGRELREEFQATVLESLDAARRGPVLRPAAAIEPGTMVRLRGLGSPGRVRRLLGYGRLEVEIGLIRMQAEVDDVLEVLPGAPPSTTAGKSLPGGVSVQASVPAGSSLTEINVIGLTAEEARERVDKFLDTAVLAGAPAVRVVHGHGMGVLRKTLWEMFASHPHVESYHPAEQHEGGAGATIVEIKP
jgi:DNA mismatch repair protein MutS2